MKQFTKSPSSWTKILVAPCSSAWKNFIVIIFLLLFGTTITYGQTFDWAIGINEIGMQSILSHKDMAVDNNSNVYVIGNFIGTVDFDPSPDTVSLTTPFGTNGYVQQMFIAKYNSNGNYIWAIEHGEYIQGSLMTVNADNVYVAATINSKSDKEGGCLNFLSKYDSNGNYIWSYDYQSDVSCMNGIFSDEFDNFYAIGWYSSGTDFDPGPDHTFLTGYGTFVLKFNDNSTSINQDIISKKEFLDIYPNPAQEFITIETTETIVNVSCYNLMGQLFLETQDKVLNISNLSVGTYLVRVMTENGVFSKKLIVQ